MRVGCLHYELVDDVRANRERLLDGLETALSAADLAVGPETATIYVERPADLDPDDRRYAANAEPVDGKTVTAAQEIVDRTGGVAVFGIPERADEERYNTCVVLEPGRDPHVYRRPRYPDWPETSEWVTAHGPLAVEHVETDTVGTVQPLVCADVLHRSSYLAEKARRGVDADVVALPANWRETEPVYREDGYEPLVDRWAAISRELPAPLAVANSYRGTELGWPSAVLDDGRVLARTDEPGDVVYATV